MMAQHALVTVFLLVSQLAAQDRVPIVGRTRLVDGSPWANATVVLQSWVHPEWPQLGVVDRIEARSDAKGRFRADGLQGRTYVAYAVLVDDMGRQLCSQPMGAGPAEAVELQSTHDWERPTTVKIAGIAPYRHLGPLRVHWPPLYAARPSVVDANDQVTMPPLPTPYAEVVVTAGDGHLLLRRVIASRNPTTFELPPPSPFLVRALDAPGGLPIADADVLLHWGDHEERLAKTDADGFAIVDLACCRHGDQIADARFRLVVHAAGRELGLVHTTDGMARSNEEIAAMRQKGECQGFATLSPSRRHHGRVMIDSNTPAANLPLLVESLAKVQPRRGASTSRKIVRLAHTDEDGAFALDDIVAGSALQVHAALPPGLVAQLPPAATPLVPLGSFNASPAARRIPADLGTTVLRDLRLCCLQIRSPDGAPALDATVFLAVPFRDGVPAALGPDRKGQLSLLLPPRVGLDVAIATADASWLGRIGGLDDEKAVVVPIALWTDRRVRCVVEDAEGTAQAAQLASGFVQADGPWRPRREVTPGIVKAPDDMFLPMLGWLPTRSIRESDGGYLLRVPNVHGRWFLRANAGDARGTVEFALDDDELDVLRVRIDRR